ncbi:hypothetical protein IKG20_01485 [Candidatus Saccharibacteria bacterium]|nr:hypothetical protein [Candidatus Saccharibacteria bacterium]
MAINFGSRLNHQTTSSYEQNSSPEIIGVYPRASAQKAGRETMRTYPGQINYSEYSRQLQAKLAELNAANSRNDKAFNKMNQSAFSAFDQVQAEERRQNF